MADEVFFILSEDKGNNTLETESRITASSMSRRIGMWGEAMFGSILTLGAGTTVTYSSSSERNILNTIVSLDTLNSG